MPVEHINRTGDRYFLQCKEGARSRPYLSRKVTGTPLDVLPDGYEIYEIPDTAQVVLRKIKPSAILPQERAMVAAAVRTQAGLEYFIVDIEDDDALVIHVADADERTIEFMIEDGWMSAQRRQKARDFTFLHSRYVKMMRFVIEDQDRRLFRAERWCFSGSMDRWIHLGFDSASLADLVQKYVRHLGKESFFDLH